MRERCGPEDRCGTREGSPPMRSGHVSEDRSSRGADASVRGQVAGPIAGAFGYVLRDMSWGEEPGDA